MKGIRAGIGVIALLTAVMPGRIDAQEVIPGGERVLTTADLPPTHWAVEAGRRAEALGLLSRPLPFLRGLPLEMALELFTEASRNARGRGEAIEALAEGWRVRLLQEFGGLTPGEGAMPDVQLLGLRGRAEVMTGVDRRAPGRGEVFPFRTGALPIADEELATVEAEAFLALGRRVGVQIAPRLRGSDAELPRVDLVIGAGSWTLAAGRQPVGFGKARPGGMVLGGTASIDRIEVKSGRPTTVEQGPLHLLGPVALELFAGRIRDDRHAREPYMWGGSFSIQPFPRLGLAVQRAAMFGGKGWDEPVTLKTVVDMLIGRVANLGFENQIVSVEARYRLPTEGTLPLTAYLEWGAEDAAGGWWDVPGRQFGLESPSIPGMEVLSVGAAFTDIAPSCCGNPPWYRHGAFNGNWALDDRPLGHPLGGEGKEWLMYGGFDEGATVRVDARLFRRHREGQNLFVPGRMWSTGGAIQAQWRPRPRLDVDLEVQVESGPDWSEHELRAGLNLFF